LKFNHVPPKLYRRLSPLYHIIKIIYTVNTGHARVRLLATIILHKKMELFIQFFLQKSSRKVKPRGG